MLALHRACDRGDLDEIRRLLQEGKHNLNRTFTAEELKEAKEAKQISDEDYNLGRATWAEFSPFDLFCFSLSGDLHSDIVDVAGKKTLQGKYYLADFIDMLIELHQYGTRQAESEEKDNGLDHLLKELVLPRGISDKTPALIRNTKAVSRLFKLFAEYRSDFKFKRPYTAADFEYLSQAWLQQKLPADKKAPSDLPLKLLCIHHLAGHWTLANKAFQQLQKKQARACIEVLGYFFAMPLTPGSLANAELWERHVRNALAAFPDEDKHRWRKVRTTEGYGTDATSWPDIYGLALNQLVNRYSSLHQYDRVRMLLVEWTHYIAHCFVTYKDIYVKGYKEDTANLFLDWPLLTPSSEANLVHFARATFSFLQDADNQAVAARAQTMGPNLCQFFFHLYFDIRRETNPQNAFFLGKALLNIMNLMLVLHQMPDFPLNISLHDAWKVYFNSTPNGSRLAHFIQCRNELEVVLNSFTRLQSIVEGSVHPFVGVVRRLERDEKIIAEQKEEIAKLQQRVAALEAPLQVAHTRMMLLPPPNEPAEKKNSFRQTTLDGWLVKKKL